MVSLVNSVKLLKNNYSQSFSNSSTLPNLFYKARITLLLKPHKDTTKKVNYRPISLMNIDVKILSKIFANQIQQHITKGHSPGSSGIYPKDGSSHTNQ